MQILINEEYLYRSKQSRKRILSNIALLFSSLKNKSKEICIKTVYSDAAHDEEFIRIFYSDMNLSLTSSYYFKHFFLFNTKRSSFRLSMT